MERTFTEQELVRREKAAKIRDLGIDPFGHVFNRTHLAQEIKTQYGELENEELEK